ncbi:TetR/AcrR family transcriptional regulator [Egicoccus halophilus]|uniref:TetR family transcriptional regulator n=1 Tax=Egicoccus halophilus TaxID=1670830 RepID=A0A8J3AH24_9ACTN|nr:TetR/AcrR family transcriptional regulator [Egicoccus halophilus]GGI08995.1 TetR family transcriptional regulator [Egicoccus halophilus]
MPPLEDRLLDAAARLIEREGPASVTTKRIAREAGCSEGSIYNHFGSKEHLVGAAVKERLMRFPARAAELRHTPGEQDVRERLAEIAELALAFYRRGAGHLAAMLSTPDAMREHVQEVAARGGGPWSTLDHLAAWLAAEQRLGRVHPDADPHAVVTALLGSVLFHAVTSHAWGVVPGAPDDATALTRAVDGVWRGLDPA